jgi:dihydropteroate synthase
MQNIPSSPDIFEELRSDLNVAISAAQRAGVTTDQLILDPGIGFGKSLEQNLAIINQLYELDFDFPIMLGTSRKSFIGRLTGREADERVFGTAASVALGIARGAHLVRVHDVGPMVEVARVADAIVHSQTV